MDLRVELDETQFPMIWIESGNFFMQWLPVTKIQIEYFLCSGSVTAFTAGWYDEVLDYNPRITPGLVKGSNYWRAFITGIKPLEIRQFISWMGSGYDMPTVDEWQKAYKELKQQEADSNVISQLTEVSSINRRAATLIRNIDISLGEISAARDGRKLADQALMRNGVMEYVYLDDRRNTYGGFGQPVGQFFGNTASPDKGKPERLIDEHEGAKMPHYGFRLIKRGS
ncbi:MAG: hypothetical protein K8L99_30065 [Anaerolineae bacterium]|nr:hypothetical protein [Anaerolineae bacterium]